LHTRGIINQMPRLDAHHPVSTRRYFAAMGHHQQSPAGGTGEVGQQLQNLLTGVRLSEWHTGYRAYRVSSLRDVSFENNSNYFDFDTQIILQMIGSRQRITEIQIPTFYGDEISRVNTIKYGLQILGHTIMYALKRLHKSA
jgi:hypothetical protein